MKTTHFRFRTPCYGRIYGDGVFEGTPYESEGMELSATAMANLYERYQRLSQFLKKNNYSDDPVKNLRIYDAVTELLKA